MEREFLRLIDVTRKAAAAASAIDRVSLSDPAVFRCLDALKRLQDFPATPSLVESSQLLKKLFPLTRHQILKIRYAATALIQKSKNRGSDHQDPKQNTTNKGNDDTRETKAIVRGSLIIRLKLPRKPTALECDTATLPRTQKNFALTSHQRRMENNLSDHHEDTKGTKTVVGGSRVIRLKLPPKPTAAKSNATTMPQANEKVSLASPCSIDISRDKVRELVLNSLTKAVTEASRVSETDPSLLATKIESVMYKAMGSFNGPNKLKYRSILFNLKDPNNPDFRRKVLRGKVTPEALVRMTTEEMASHQRRKENEQIRKNALSKTRFEV